MLGDAEGIEGLQRREGEVGHEAAEVGERGKQTALLLTERLMAL